MGYVVVIGVILIFAIYKISETQTNKRSLALFQSLKQFEPAFNKAVSDFHNLIQGNWYISDKRYREWKATYAPLSKKLNVFIPTVKTQDPLKQLILDFSSFWHDGRRLFIDEFNAKFVAEESPIIQRMLSERDIKNNNDQVTAIASDEDNTLLVAGAGTGKTTTILGKLAYLIERAGVQPEDILLLSFTGRAVDELKDRISKKFPDKDIKTQTFHSFGLSVIGSALNEKPDLAFPSSSAKQNFLNEEFNKLLQDSKYLHEAVSYFAYYFKPVVLELGFKSFDDYYKYIKTEENLTLKKEVVKSQQEVMIANFLYVNGVNYIYESPYKYKTATSSHRQYKPDFYLPDYGLYIEHFGINRDNQVHFTHNESQNALKTIQYRKKMAWKRDVHKQNQTVLIETFSYEFTERNWTELLTEKLIANKVIFSERNIDEIFSALKSTGNVKKIVELFATFLDLCKSNGYDVLKLQSIVSSRNDPREIVFIDIFSPIYQAYEDYLTKSNSIDFHDMLIKAAYLISEKRFKVAFKYIIIDEFQDFSVSKSTLIKALCTQNPDAKLFCVGDDWQSIFRFAGSDISLMTNFEEMYGFTRQNKLVITNRFNNRIADVSNQFILKNPNQIKKEVRSTLPEAGEAVEIKYRKGTNDSERIIKEILSTLNNVAARGAKTATVFLLGRYKHNKPEEFSKYQRLFKSLLIEYLTIHSSKGSEADYVIIIDVLSGKYGFPSEVTDDPLLEIVLSKGDSYPHAEERRLMYVAMTRARHKVFIVSEKGKQSVFVLELEGAKNPKTATTMRCKECSGEMVQRTSRYGVFYGCSNFPECNYKVNIKNA